MKRGKTGARRRFSTRRPNLAKTSFGSEASIQTAAGSRGVQTQPAWFCRDWFWGLVLILSVLLVYTPVWKAGYIWDDEIILTANPCIVGPLGLKEIWTTRAADICPLTLTTFWVEHALWGLNPRAYHLVNVLLHAACALLLWQVLRSLRVPGAWLGATLWALHPVMVESVAWVTEMKNTESCLFFLLAILFFVRWLRAKDLSVRTGGGWNYALTLLFAALAMASKSSTVVLPVVLCLCAWWVEGRWHWGNVTRVVPMFLMAIVAGTASIFTQRFFLEGIGSDPQWARSWPERLATAGDAVWFYLGKLLWPHPLITIYPRWQIPAAPWAPSLALLVMFVILSIFWLKRHAWSRACLFAFAYFLVALLPALGLIDNSIFRYSPVFDHLQYLASIGPLALAGAGLVVLSNSIVPKERWLRSSMCVGLLIVLGMTSWQRIWVYESPETLWTDTLAKNPDCWICHSNLGDALLKKGRLDKAILEYRRALEIKPKDAVAHRDLGNVFLKEGKLDEAISEYQKALEIKPNFLGARSNLGGALLQKGQMNEAVEQFQKALELRPEKAAEAAVRYNLGNALSQKGQLNEALAQYQKSVEINPDYAEARNGLGVALAKKGQMYEAIGQFEEALRIRPDFSPAQDNLARARAMVRQSDGHE